MLQSIKQLYGNKLGASDGEIGHVKDFYFDDQNWAVRYLVVDTGSWLPGRKVLISPHSLGRFDPAAKVLCVNLTRKQIENSPSIESHTPISRQYEAEYFRYYGWPNYWEGGGLWGMTALPTSEAPVTPSTIEPETANGPQPERTDAHLRSTQAVNGYHLRANNETIGLICDFLMDSERWAIARLVIKIGHRFTGKEVQIPVGKVERISYEESAVFVNSTAEAIEQSSGRDLSPVVTVN